MADYPASGAFFTNDRKQSPTQPDYTGNLSVEHDVVHDLMRQIEEGVEHPKIDLAGWKKVSKNGRAFMSLRGSVLRDRREQSTPMARQAPMGRPTADVKSAVPDDEIPF